MFNKAFLKALADHFRREGAKVIERVAKNQPAALASPEPQPCPYDKPNCPLGRLWLCPTQVLDTWHRDRRAVGPDRWLTAGLLRQRQPNGQVEAGSIKDLPCADVARSLAAYAGFANRT